MEEFNFITVQETYRALYFQLPKVLFTSPLYKDMSNDSKIAYAMLQDRCEASIENNWIDEHNRIFFIFTRAELMNILGCKENKISKIKKELKSKNLLFEKRTPPKKLPNGEWLNSPNRLYLGKLEVTAEDVFLNQKNKSNIKKFESGKKQPSKEALIEQESYGSGKKQPSKEKPLNQYLFESGKKGGNLIYSNNLDTNRHLIDTENDQLQNKVLLDNFVDIMKEDSINTFVPEKVLSLIKTFSNTYEDAQQTVQTIHNAKKKAEELEQTIVIYEELESYGIDADKGLYMTLLKAYQKQKTEKVKNLQNLIFVYIKNWFIEKVIMAKLANEQREMLNEAPTVSMENWLE
ncbi:MAG: replication initiator protein A [Enterococcus hirae]|nr:replication initiator protein A [Enterococcus hirae]